MMTACHNVDIIEDIIDHDVDDGQNVHMEETAESNVLDDDSDIQLYLKSLSLFYLKLQAKYLVLSSTIQHIITDIQDVHKLGQSYLTDKLIERITKHFDLPKSVVQQIIHEVMSCNLFEKCTVRLFMPRAPARALLTSFDTTATQPSVFATAQPSVMLLSWHHCQSWRSNS